MAGMEREAVRAFVDRNRAAVADAKAGWWAGRDRQAALRTSWALWKHARTVRPDWPTAQERGADLDHHVSLKALLDRAARAVSRS